jgi:hypothetical protein
LRVVIESIRRYREGLLNVEGLQQNIASVMTALEGDVPKEVRETIYEAEAAIELISFTVASAEQATALEKVFSELEGVIANHE